MPPVPVPIVPGYNHAVPRTAFTLDAGIQSPVLCLRSKRPQPLRHPSRHLYTMFLISRDPYTMFLISQNPYSMFLISPNSCNRVRDDLAFGLPTYAEVLVPVAHVYSLHTWKPPTCDYCHTHTQMKKPRNTKWMFLPPNENLKGQGPHHGHICSCSSCSWNTVLNTVGFQSFPRFVRALS